VRPRSDPPLLPGGLPVPLAPKHAETSCGFSAPSLRGAASIGTPLARRPA